ncbi:5'/3'-nucleotidase SurE [Gemmatimonas aurantiaca]|uniref:5'/3'-nucleotidase SurE n=1 Tax=Gemmatimonas aurantiaca TaxID=173480 RepID=UPI00301C5CF5
MIRWVIAIALGLLTAWLAYGRGRGVGAGSSSRTSAWGLAVLRMLAVTIVAALMLGAPSGRARPLPPLLAIDASASWRRAVGDESTAVRGWRQRLVDSVMPTVGADAPLVLVGDSLRDGTRDDLTHWVPGDMASRVRPAVDRAASMGRALVLVTDGELDDADVLTEAPAGSRVVTMADVAGSAARRDVAMADLSVPASATAADTISVSATLVAGGTATPDGTMAVLLDGAEVATVPVPALAPYASTRVTAGVTMPRGARIVLLQSVVRVAADAEPRNDTLTVAIDVGDRPTAVFVSTSPDLDVREVLTVLRGALDVPTRAYLRVAPNVWRVEGTLAPISEAEVRARAAAAGMLILHGDTSWMSPRAAPGVSTGSATVTSAAARALWVPAPPTLVARAGELTRTAEWYVAGAPASPLMSALVALPFDSLPPITLAGPATGANAAANAGTSSGTVDAVLTARLGKRGDPVAAIAAREERGTRAVIISGSGYAGWALRGGRPKEAFTALWGAIFDWVAAGRGDARAARPVAGLVRAGDPVSWRRGGADTLVAATISRRVAGSPSAARARDSITLAFASRSFETTSSTLPPGVYDVETRGGPSVLVVNASREWVPRAPAVTAGPASRTASASDAPRLVDSGWPFVLALLLLCAEWIGRRVTGQR